MIKKLKYNDWNLCDKTMLDSAELFLLIFLKGNANIEVTWSIHLIVPLLNSTAIE